MSNEGPKARVEPLLKLNFLSHGTIECKDLERARRFYQELLGLEVVQTSAVSLQLRLNSATTITCVKAAGENKGSVLNHFGFDVATRDEVNDAYEIVVAHKHDYGILKLTKPAEQHGGYSFYIQDADGNFWEILTNPPGGYSYLFEKGEQTKTWSKQRSAS